MFKSESIIEYKDKQGMTQSIDFNNFAEVLISANPVFDWLGDNITTISFKLLKGFITNMILKIEKESLSDRNFGNSALDYIKQYVSKYRNKFDNGGNMYGDILGKIINKDACTELQMNKIAFNEMISSAGFENTNIVLKELKDAGMLSCDKDRLTRSRKNSSGYTEEVYVVILDKNELHAENPVSSCKN